MEYNEYMRPIFSAFFRELEKIAVSRSLSTYGPQARVGRRPIRVQKAIERDNEFWNRVSREEDPDDRSAFYDHEGFQQYSTVPESGDDKDQRYFASGA